MDATILIEKEQVFTNDQHYLESYSTICQFLSERYEILEDTLERWRVPSKEKKDHERALERLKELNQIIQDEEWFFWEKVARAKNTGKRFIFEEFAASYGLSHLEKRVALFFLCSRISRPYGLFLSKFWIMEVFDVERSLINRIGSLSIFDEEKPLIKSGILIATKEGDWEHYIYKYKLNPKFLNFFCQRLNGVEIRWEGENKEVQEKTSQFGLIKDPNYSLDDVILPDTTKEQIRFFLSTYKDGSLNRLGLNKIVKKGRGLTFLFYGPPGTGKSMLAEAVASYLGKKVLVAETSKIMSCWLGETDKNISRAFEYAKANDLVLLLDEADSLLYSRNLTSFSYNVRFTNTMLTELERFDGVAIFTSNMDCLLDEAMERRIALKVKFEIPKPQERAFIWRVHIPPEVRLSDDVNFALLAAKYEFTGGYIRNVIINALRRVAFRNSDTLTMEDLLFSAQMEKEGMFVKENKTKIGFFAHS